MTATAHTKNVVTLTFCRVLAEAWLEAGELRAWLSAQAAWLDGLQRRLRPDTSRAARADAEDISDELYVS